MIAVCLEVILCAPPLAFLPRLARSSIHCFCSMRFVGRGGILMFLNSSRGSIILVALKVTVRVLGCSSYCFANVVVDW